MSTPVDLTQSHPASLNSYAVDLIYAFDCQYKHRNSGYRNDAHHRMIATVERLLSLDPFKQPLSPPVFEDDDTCDHAECRDSGICYYDE